MFGLSNSKKTLAISSILLLCVGCVRGSHSKEVDWERDNERTDYGTSSSDMLPPSYDENDEQLDMKVKSGGFFGGLMKMMFSKPKNIMFTLLFCAVFAIGMTAMFGNFTCMHKEAGKMLFGDNGSSMWLRLAVIVPCLTISLGACAVVSVRAYKKSGCPEKYDEWKQHNGPQSSSRWLQYATCVAMIVFAFIACHFGGLKNAGEVMHLISWVLPASIGCIGLLFVVIKHVKSNKNLLEEKVEGEKKKLKAVEAKNNSLEAKNNSLEAKNHSLEVEFGDFKVKNEKALDSAMQKLEKAETKAKTTLQKLDKAEKDLKQTQHGYEFIMGKCGELNAIIAERKRDGTNDNDYSASASGCSEERKESEMKIGDQTQNITAKQESFEQFEDVTIKQDDALLATLIKAVPKRRRCE